MAYGNLKFALTPSFFILDLVSKKYQNKINIWKIGNSVLLLGMG